MHRLWLAALVSLTPLPLAAADDDYRTVDTASKK